MSFSFFKKSRPKTPLELENFENRDLQIREGTHDCLSLIQGVLSQHPDVAEQAPYSPQEVLEDFLTEGRDKLDHQFPDLSGSEKDALELEWLDMVRQGLKDEAFLFSPPCRHTKNNKGSKCLVSSGNTCRYNEVLPNLSQSSRSRDLDKLLLRPGHLVGPNFEPVEELRDDIKEYVKVLVVGAGGLGCELLKDLALTGFKNIDVIDMDRIEVTNLTRQFLFRLEDVGKPKADVAAKRVMERVSGVDITPHFCRIEDKPLDFYSDFSIIVLGLDSIEARSYINAVACGFLEYDSDDNPREETVKPMVDGGTEGFKGHARIIVPGTTPCFECTIWLFPPQVKFPLCTLAETPRNAAHCIEYAHLIKWDEVHGKKSFDSDNPEDMQWVYSEAVKRAELFGIQGVTYSLMQGVVKNIIPAIASTNAIISAACALETLSTLSNYLTYNGVEGLHTKVTEFVKDKDGLVCGPGVLIELEKSVTLKKNLPPLKKYHETQKRSTRAATNIILLFIVLLFTLPSVVSSVKFDNFELEKDSIILLGEAQILNGVLYLSRQDSGTAIFRDPIRFDETKSFSTNFTFTVTNDNPLFFGDGLTFFLSPNNQTLGSKGYLGLVNSLDLTSNQFVAVEFDTKMNMDFDDPDDNHVGLDINSLISIKTANVSDVGIRLKSGVLIYAWIDYSSEKKSLEVFLSSMILKPDEPLLRVDIDLSDNLKGFVYVGFSASTEGGSEVHTIERWNFETVGFSESRSYPPEEANNNYTSSPVTVSHSQSRNHKLIGLGIGLTLSALSLLIIVKKCVDDREKVSEIELHQNVVDSELSQRPESSVNSSPVFVTVYDERGDGPEDRSNDAQTPPPHTDIRRSTRARQPSTRYSRDYVT